MSAVGVICVTLPVRLVSEANLHDHWAVKAGRVKAQRKAARMVVANALRTFDQDGGRPVRITITRVSPRELDGDNMQSAAKAVRDGIADALGYRNDSHPHLTWVYAQSKGGPGCEVTLEFAL